MTKSSQNPTLGQLPQICLPLSTMSDAKLLSPCRDPSLFLSPRVRSTSHVSAPDLEESCDPSVPHVQSASLQAALSNIILAVLGAGQLTLPYALSQLGLGCGLVALVAFTVLSVHSLHTLSVHELHLQKHAGCCLHSYSELVTLVLGSAGSHICSALLALYAWGGALSFLVILKSELGFLWQAFGPDHNVQQGPGACLLVLVALFIIWPLSSLEDLSGLKTFSPCGCGAAIFITCVTLACTPWKSALPDFSEACEGPAGARAFPEDSLAWYPASFMAFAATVPLLAFALNSSWAYIPVLCTLREKSPGRVGGLIVGSNVIILLNYFLLAANGYVMFCGRTHPNILDSLGAEAKGANATLVLLAKVALAVQLTLALPMRFFVARRTVAENLGFAGRVALSAVLVASATFLATIPGLSLATVLGVVSSVCASMIIYILPAIVDLRMGLPGFVRKIGSVVSLLVGMFVLIAGLVANLMGVSVGS